jgi:hypothetical protein
MVWPDLQSGQLAWLAFVKGGLLVAGVVAPATVSGVLGDLGLLRRAEHLCSGGSAFSSTELPQHDGCRQFTGFRPFAGGTEAIGDLAKPDHSSSLEEREWLDGQADTGKSSLPEWAWQCLEEFLRRSGRMTQQLCLGYRLRCGPDRERPRDR